MLLTEGQMSDHRGATQLLPHLPAVHHLIGDRGYESNRFRQALVERRIEPCIPSTKSLKVPIPHDKARYRRRHKVKNMFGRMKDWHRISMRYDRCAHTFFSAICHLEKLYSDRIEWKAMTIPQHSRTFVMWMDAMQRRLYSVQVF